MPRASLAGALVKIAVGSASIFWGWGYLYYPRLIERINIFLREVLFNDTRRALERKKWGIFFIILGLLLCVMGLESLTW